ncbi:MAG: hypothetical protein GX777_02960 [Fastidiosipila sp.]|nr:hypothetical protein [Fastidiosipila sp.]
MSNNVIIGTAGHVDHGKTSLINALTEIDTDRLKEERAPIFHVSSSKGEGVDELRQALIQAVAAAADKKTSIPFRLPIDRVFTLSGIGTVVTGTLIEGKLCNGDEAELYPQKKKVRVRSLQVHDQAVEQAEAGQRVAVNLSGTNKKGRSRARQYPG